jgi:hypothetical protein
LNVNEEIDKLLNDFTEKWAKDLEVSLFDALKKGGRGNPSAVDIRFKGGVSYGVGKVTLGVKTIGTILRMVERKVRCHRLKL